MRTKDLTVGMVVGYGRRRDTPANLALRAVVLDLDRWAAISPFGRLSGGVRKSTGKGSGIPLMVEEESRGELVWSPALANPANIIGPWDEVVAQAEADARRAADIKAHRQAANHAHAVAFSSDIARAERFDVSISTSQPTGFAVEPSRYTLSRADLLKLLDAAEKET